MENYDSFPRMGDLARADRNVRFFDDREVPYRRPSQQQIKEPTLILDDALLVVAICVPRSQSVATPGKRILQSFSRGNGSGIRRCESWHCLRDSNVTTGCIMFHRKLLTKRPSERILVNLCHYSPNAGSCQPRGSECEGMRVFIPS